MEPGRFRERIVFEEPTGGSDGLGGKAVEWTARAEVRAYFAPPRARELVLADREASRNVFTVIIHTSATARSITPKWRVRHARRPWEVYNILAIDLRRHDGLVSMVVEGGA